MHDDNVLTLFFSLFIVVLFVFNTAFSGISLNNDIVPVDTGNCMKKYIQEASNDAHYEPRNITPSNASYHLSDKKFNIEWWYFEGVFENDYNAVVNIIVASKKNLGLCITHLNIFHGHNISISFSKRKIQSINRFYGSESFPDILINGKQAIDFEQETYNASKKWVYHVTYELDGHAVDLKFVGLVPGWEGDVLGGNYGPVLPIADVRGTITLNNNVVNVTGLGYHEHAYGISFPIWEWGWYWGKIVGDTTSFTWGKMMNTFWSEQGRAGVLSKKNSSYINIAQEHIEMKLLDYEFHERRFIPTKFVFNVTDTHHKLFMNVTMTTVHIQHLPFGFLNYWRYLLKINGEIVYNNIREEINNKTQIMELMRFR